MQEENGSNRADRISRRLFAQTALSAVAIDVLLSSTAKADSATAIDGAGKPEDFSDRDWDEVQARYKNLLRVYGSRLSATEKQRVLHILITNQHMLKSIRSFVVQNGDASASTLRLVT